MGTFEAIFVVVGVLMPCSALIVSTVIVDDIFLLSSRLLREAIFLSSF
jgi:hypothetical protein